MVVSYVLEVRSREPPVVVADPSKSQNTIGILTDLFHPTDDTDTLDFLEAIPPRNVHAYVLEIADERLDHQRSEMRGFLLGQGFREQLSRRRTLWSDYGHAGSAIGRK